MSTPRPRPRNSGWHVQQVSTAVVVMACFAMSAVGLYGYGIDGLALHPAIAALIPVGVDLLAICGMYASYAMRNSRWHIRAYSWLVFGVSVGLSMAANTVHAAALDRPVAGVIGAMFPPLLLAFAVHLLIVSRREQDRQVREWASTEATAAAAREAAGVPVSGLDAHLPACVYHAHGDDDAVIYTGSTTDLPTRIRKHRTNSPWFDEVARWSFTAYESITVAGAEEKAAIRRDQPKYNDHHNPVRPSRKGRAAIASASADTPPDPPAMTPLTLVKRIPALPPAPATESGDGVSVDAIRKARAGNPAATQKQVAGMAGVSVRTVARHWRTTAPPVNGGTPHAT